MNKNFYQKPKFSLDEIVRITKIPDNGRNGINNKLAVIRGVFATF